MNLISAKDLPAKGIPYSNSHRRRLEARGDFPKRVPLSGGRYAYVLEEIERWIADRVSARKAA